jgi:hypothetical protein
MDINGLIDSRNIDLWYALSKVREISIKRENVNTYSAFSKDNKTTIYIPLNHTDPASFTHELLHVFLRTKDVYIGAGLQISVKESKVLSKIFSEKLIEHIGNCLDHIKMYPEFVKLGYNPEEFLSDYSENKLTNDEILNIKKYFVRTGFFKKAIYNKSAIDVFIGKYFAAISCPNKTFEYTRQLLDLKHIDSDLYCILDRFITSWMSFDYNDNDPLTSGYHTLLFDFIESLENWTTGKLIK